jgi:hypothetical protein
MALRSGRMDFFSWKLPRSRAHWTRTSRDGSVRHRRAISRTPACPCPAVLSRITASRRMKSRGSLRAMRMRRWTASAPPACRGGPLAVVGIVLGEQNLGTRYVVYRREPSELPAQAGIRSGTGPANTARYRRSLHRSLRRPRPDGAPAANRLLWPGWSSGCSCRSISSGVDVGVLKGRL